MADGSRHAAYYVKETVYGTVPTNPTMAKIRHTGCTLGIDKDTLSSAELRDDRNISDFRMGQNKAGGSIDMEALNDVGFEDFLAAVLCSDWATNVLKNGTTRQSFAVLRYFGDLAAGNKPYHISTGVEFASVDVKITANALVTAKFDTIAQSYTAGEAAPTGSTLSAATTTTPMDAFTGAITEGGSSIAVVTEVSFKIDNNMDRRFVIGSRNTIRPSVGRCNVTGSLTAYFESIVMLDKFLSEADSSLSVQLTAGTDTLTALFPKIRYTGGKPDVSGEGPITLTMPFQAVYDSSTGAAIQFTRSA